MLLVYYLVALLIAFAALEYYILHREHSYEQRFLPLVLGLQIVYLFYLIVENISGAVFVFTVLKYLLLLQFVYLVFYYILDFIHTKLPTWVNVFIFTGIGIGNIVLIYAIYNDFSYRSIVLFIVFTFAAVTVIRGALAIYKNSKAHKVQAIYKLLYLALILPLISVIISEAGIIDEHIIMPAMVIFFCLIIMYLMVTGQFYGTSQYIKEDFFYKYDGCLMLFDDELTYIDSTNKTKEIFVEDVADLEANTRSYRLVDTIREWSKTPNENYYQKYHDKYYKARMHPVLRDGKVRGYILSIDDVTKELKEAEKAKHETAQKSEFLANMSHELRSPLNAIIGGSDVILEKRDLSETSRVMVSRINDAGRNLLDIVNSILDYSKLEAGKLELMDNTYDIKAIIEKITYDTATTLKDSKVSFNFSLSTSAPRVIVGDRNRVNIIIKNIISNAVKTTLKGSIKCDIKAEPLNDENILITFVCADSGPGMSEEEQKDIFSKYVSFNDQTIAESTGIGLYLAGQLCEMMGGEATAYSDGKSGSTITASFIQKIGSKDSFRPFSYNETILNSDYESAQDHVKPGWIYPDANVLVVDDMKVNREIFAAKSRKWGFNIIEAESGYESIEIAKKEDIDLIIMDQMMPNMSGLEAFDEIRKFSDVPVILLTANTSDGLVKESENRGFAGYMAKPIKITVLKRFLEENLPASKRKNYVDDSYEAYPELTFDPNFVYVLEAYIEDLEDIMPNLHKYFEEDLDMFRVKVHGIKGISRQIGKRPIGDSAEIMEMAAKAGHRDYISRHLDAFIDDLTVILEETKKEYEVMPK